MAEAQSAVETSRAVLAAVDAAGIKEKIAQDLGFVETAQESTTVDAFERDEVIQEYAGEQAKAILDIRFDDAEALARVSKMADTMGLTTQQASGRKNVLLENSIQRLAKTGSEGKEVAGNLVDLRLLVEDLDPNDEDFSTGWWSRLLAKVLPKFVSAPIRKYFMKYESAKTNIDALVENLRRGREMLTRDNVTMETEQVEMRALTIRLMRVIAIGRVLLGKVKDHVATLSPDDEKRKFFEERVIFPLQERITSLQQQLLVNQQGYVALEVLIENNKVLIRGVITAENTTVQALRIAVTVAMALANQEIVLKSVQAINETTNKMLLGTAQRIRQQGVSIQKQAVEGSLKMDTLKQAFTELKGALSDIENFRRNAIPQQEAIIEELGELAKEAEKSIQKIERGHDNAPMIDDLDADSASKVRISRKTM